MDKQQTQAAVETSTAMSAGPSIIRRLLNTVPDELLKLLAEIEAQESSQDKDAQ